MKLRPALVPLVVFETKRAQSMQGVSMRNIRMTSYQCKADEIDPSLTQTRTLGGV